MKRYGLFLVVILLLVTMTGYCEAEKADFYVAKNSSDEKARITVNGKAAASIVTPKLSSDTIRLAASELQHYVAEISGALLPIVTDETEVKGNRILLGMTRFTQRAGLNVSPQDPGRDGFVLKTDGRDVLVVGSDDTGTLYGTYELLENLGVRWFFDDPLGTVVPRRSTIRVPGLDQRQKPDFRMRWSASGEWNMRNKGNLAKMVQGKRKKAGKFAPCELKMFPKGYPYHSMYTFLPHEKYFPDHPEYFALVDGKRSDNGDAKPCTTNPEVIRVVADNMAKALDEHPDIDLITLSPKDGLFYCQCQRCRALDEPGAVYYRAKTYRILTFYNQVAERLAKTHPKVRILAGAYDRYNEPPLDKSFRAHPNLSLIICHYVGYCQMHPVTDPNCPPNTKYQKLIADWQRLIPEIYFYEYYDTGGWGGLPCPLVHTVAADIPYFKQIGSGGLYSQYTQHSAWNNGLTHYIAAKLLWNSQSDVTALLEDFYQKFFQRAAGPMKRYYTALDEAVAGTKEHLCTCQNTRPERIFTLDLLQRLDEYLTEAQQLAKSEVVKARLQRVAVSLEYTHRFIAYRTLYLKAVNGPSQERAGAAREALKVIKALHDDVTQNPAKYSGILYPKAYFWVHHLGPAKKLVEALNNKK